MAEDNVVPFPGKTLNEIPVGTILSAAALASLKDVIVIGQTENGDQYFASSSGYLPDILWLIKNAEMQVMTAGQEE